MTVARALLPLALASLAPLGAAAPVSYAIGGLVSSADTRNAYGAPIAPSSLTQEFVAGTPVDLTVTYDPAAPPVADSGGGTPRYNLPYTFRGRIGNRAFTATGGYVELLTNGTTSDIVEFEITPGYIPAGVTPHTLTEANPFTGTGYQLTSIRFFVNNSAPVASGSASLPADLSGYFASGSFGITYSQTSTASFVSASGPLRTVSPVPEPAAFLTLGIGGLALVRRRHAER